MNTSIADNNNCLEDNPFLVCTYGRFKVKNLLPQTAPSIAFILINNISVSNTLIQNIGNYIKINYWPFQNNYDCYLNKETV